MPNDKDGVTITKKIVEAWSLAKMSDAKLRQEAAAWGFANDPDEFIRQVRFCS